MGFLARLFGPNIDKLTEKGDIDGLVEVLDTGPSVELQLTAIEALTNLAGEQSIAALVKSLAAEDPAVRQAAEKGLRRLGTEASAALLSALETDLGDRALALLLELGADTIEPLRSALDSSNDAARRRALAGIQELDSRLQEPEVREIRFRTLLAALGDRSAECRVDAANGLAELADSRAARALAAQLKDGDETVRAACCRALGEIGDAATPYLADALADRNANARRLAADLLGKVCREESDIETLTLAFGVLLEHVKDSDLEVRENTMHALESMPTKAVIKNQLELLADPERSDRDEIHEFLLAVLEHAQVSPEQRATALGRIQAFGFDSV